MYTSLLTIIIVYVGYIYWCQKRKNISYIAYLFVIGAVALTSYFVFYLPVNSYVKGIPFAFAPFAIPHTLTESQSLFYNKEFTLGRYYMVGLGKISPKLILYESLSALLFLFINLGTRILFPLYFIKNKFTLESLLLGLTTIIGLALPIFFIQKSGGWYNSIQFGYLSIYTAGILSAMFVDSLMQSKIRYLPWLVAIFIIAVSIPNTLLALKFVTKEKILISDSEINALSFLKDKPSGVVLSLPDSKNSSYVPAFSKKIGYMIDDEQSALMNFPTGDRRKKIDERNCALLNEINYIYLINNIGLEFTRCEEIKTFKKIYDKEGILIYSKL